MELARRDKVRELAKFDIDLQYGQEGEQWLKILGTDQAKMEVKTERDRWAETGNAVFEYECRSHPSGIAVTTSDYWCHNFMLNDRCCMSYVFNVDDLKQFLRMCIKTPGYAGSRLTIGGDDNASRVILVPITELWRITCNTLPFRTRNVL